MHVMFACGAAAGVVCFVTYHLLGAVVLHRLGRTGASKAFNDVRFLVLATMLGAACTLVYFGSGGSVWAATVMHWLPVCVWLCVFDGEEKLSPSPTTPTSFGCKTSVGLEIYILSLWFILCSFIGTFAT